MICVLSPQYSHLLFFVGILMWVFSKRNKQDFEEAARLPLDLDGDPKLSQRN